MVEDERLPFILTMAFLAFITITAGVNIIDSMAGHAFPC